MEASPNDWRKEAAAEISARRISCVRDIEQARRAVERAQAKLLQAETRLEDIDRGARALGLPVLEAYEPTAAAHVAAEESGGPLVRDVILRLLKNAFPNSMRAGEIKDAAEAEIGRTLHFKTPGMTLYRLSKDGYVSRQGRDWSYSPDTDPDRVRQRGKLWEILNDAGEGDAEIEDWEPDAPDDIEEAI